MIDPALAQRGLYEVDLRDVDERVERAGWVFSVRAVKRRRELTRGEWDGGKFNLLAEGMMWAFNALRRRMSTKRSWPVGVVRLGNVSSWHDQRPVIVHLEQIARDADPAPPSPFWLHRLRPATSILAEDASRVPAQAHGREAFTAHAAIRAVLPMSGCSGVTGAVDDILRHRRRRRSSSAPGNCQPLASECFQWADGEATCVR